MMTYLSTLRTAYFSESCILKQGSFPVFEQGYGKNFIGKLVEIYLRTYRNISHFFSMLDGKSLIKYAIFFLPPLFFPTINVGKLACCSYLVVTILVVNISNDIFGLRQEIQELKIEHLCTVFLPQLLFFSSVPLHQLIYLRYLSMFDGLVAPQNPKQCVDSCVETGSPCIQPKQRVWTVQNRINFLIITTIFIAHTLFFGTVSFFTNFMIFNFFSGYFNDDYFQNNKIMHKNNAFMKATLSALLPTWFFSFSHPLISLFDVAVQKVEQAHLPISNNQGFLEEDAVSIVMLLSLLLEEMRCKAIYAKKAESFPDDSAERKSYEQKIVNAEYYITKLLSKINLMGKNSNIKPIDLDSLKISLTDVHDQMIRDAFLRKIILYLLNNKTISKHVASLNKLKKNIRYEHLLSIFGSLSQESGRPVADDFQQLQNFKKLVAFFYLPNVPGSDQVPYRHQNLSDSVIKKVQLFLLYFLFLETYTENKGDIVVPTLQRSLYETFGDSFSLETMVSCYENPDSGKESAHECFFKRLLSEKKCNIRDFINKLIKIRPDRDDIKETKEYKGV